MVDDICCALELMDCIVRYEAEEVHAHGDASGDAAGEARSSLEELHDDGVSDAISVLEKCDADRPGDRMGESSSNLEQCDDDGIDDALRLLPRFTRRSSKMMEHCRKSKSTVDQQKVSRGLDEHIKHCNDHLAIRRSDQWNPHFKRIARQRFRRPGEGRSL
jgi:hypothetical protein